MPGPSLKVLGGVRVIAQPTTAPGSSVADQAFGDGTPNGPPSRVHPLSITSAHGMRFWLGVAGVVTLVWVYHSLPE